MRQRSLAILLTAVGTSLAAIPACTHDASPTETSPPPIGVASDEAAARAAFASAPLGRVVARDAFGAARFVMGARLDTAVPANVSAETAARVHLSRHAKLLGLSEASVRDAVLAASHELSEGAGIVQFKQRVGGVEVFHSRASVVLDASKNLVSIGNGLLPIGAGLRAPKQMAFRLPPESALARVYAARTGVDLPADAVRDSGPLGEDFRGYSMRTPQGALRILEASAKRVLYPEGKALVPAYHVELLARAPGSNENQARAYVLAADDGRVLYDVSLTENDAFNYRVWADPAGNHIPLDGPLVDYTPHPTGIPDKVVPGYQAPIMVMMESFKTKPTGVIDPWLAADATFTFGNNVRAYSDRNDYLDDAGAKHLDGYDDGIDIRGDVTSAKTFDRVYDVTKAPETTPDQIKAAVTQIFYVTNWLHDYWYDSGFDEKSGVAQLSNLGRPGGGAEGDPLRAEAQDSALSGQSNNANMSTFADGRSPRMQMYVWTGLPNRTLTTVPAIPTINDGIGASGFGPQTFDVTGTAVLSDDASTVPVPAGPTPGTTSDACQVPINVMGRIAVIDRGICAFTLKATNAQMAGAIGIILLNNAPGHTPSNPGGVAPVTIPLLSLSQEEGVPLKAALAAGTVTAHLVRGAEIQHDGTIDNTVVAHEWGHYLHHRLVVCGSQSCGGMSEGWADFNAIVLALKDGDIFDNTKTYAVAQYAAAGLLQNAGYFGIRRAPYSTDLTKNPFTFGHIRKMSKLPTTAPLAAASPDMSEVHNVGEIWTQTLFEAYVNLLAAGKAATPPRTFEETKRRMADYVVAGMKAAPGEPTFTEQRDALLAAVLAIPGRADDFIALANGFAKRGLGVGAKSPPTSSVTLDEAVENFDVKGNLAFLDATLDDSVTSCDHDGVLDKGESGKITMKVQNSGWVKLTQSKVIVATTDPNITFANGGNADIAALDPYGTATITIGISAKDTVAKRGLLPITVTLSDPEAFATTADTPFLALYNFDEKTAAAAIDDVEAAKSAWELAHGAKPARFAVWERQGDAANHFWHGDDIGTSSDEYLVSPDLVVSPTNPFIIAFTHRYSFESGPVRAGGPDVAFDGGVLEISVDGGMTWQDVSTYADPGYTQTIYTTAPPPPGDGGTSEAGPAREAGVSEAGGAVEAGDAADSAGGEPDTNALAGRMAWGGDSPGYPSYLNVSLDLGTKLAGKTVKVRFRLGTDDGTGAPGWDIDNIAFGSNTFSSLTNEPFSSIVDNSGLCSDGGVVGDAGSNATDGGARADASKEGGVAAGPAPAPPSDSGCGCRIADPPSSHHAALAMSVLAGLCALRRRRAAQRIQVS